MQLFEFLNTSKEHLEKDLFSLIEATLISLGIQIPIGQEMRVIDGLLLVIVFLWVEISFHGRAKSIVSRSSTEAEYQTMAHATRELVWLKHLLQELSFCEVGQMELVCDNQSALHFSSNPICHERTKHIEVDCHFIREKILSGVIKPHLSILRINLQIFS